MEEIFIEFLDQMYWEGYANQFMEDNPKAFQNQMNEFENMYCVYKKAVRLRPKAMDRIRKNTPKS